MGWSSSLPSEPNPDNWLQRTLTVDNWELDNDQLWEVLEAIRFETVMREGEPHTSHPRQTCGSLGAAVKPVWPMREWALKGEW